MVQENLAPHLLARDPSKVHLGEISSGRPLNWENFGPTFLNILLYVSIRETIKKQ
jgi:hypothetical protein